MSNQNEISDKRDRSEEVHEYLERISLGLNFCGIQRILTPIGFELCHM